MTNCPFCNSAPVVEPWRYPANTDETFTVACVNEMCPQAPSAYGATPEAAQQSWVDEVADNFGIMPDGITLKPERLDKMRAAFRKNYAALRAATGEG